MLLNEIMENCHFHLRFSCFAVKPTGIIIRHDRKKSIGQTKLKCHIRCEWNGKRHTQTKNKNNNRPELKRILSFLFSSVLKVNSFHGILHCVLVVVVVPSTGNNKSLKVGAYNENTVTLVCVCESVALTCTFKKNTSLYVWWCGKVLGSTVFSLSPHFLSLLFLFFTITIWVNCVSC